MLRLREPKRGRDLPPRLGPDQRSDLRAAVDLAEAGPRERVVEVDAAVV